MEDAEEQKEPADNLIGPATISELRKTIAVCTQTHQSRWFY